MKNIASRAKSLGSRCRCGGHSVRTPVYARVGWICAYVTCVRVCACTWCACAGACACACAGAQAMAYVCVPGQGQEGGAAAEFSWLQTQKGCEDVCNSRTGCGGFDFSDKSGVAAPCRVYSSLLGKQTPRKGNPGGDNRYFVRRPSLALLCMRPANLHLCSFVSRCLCAYFCELEVVCLPRTALVCVYCCVGGGARGSCQKLTTHRQSVRLMQRQTMITHRQSLRLRQRQQRTPRWGEANQIYSLRPTADLRKASTVGEDSAASPLCACCQVSKSPAVVSHCPSLDFLRPVTRDATHIISYSAGPPRSRILAQRVCGLMAPKGASCSVDRILIWMQPLFRVGLNIASRCTRRSTPTGSRRIR